MMASNLLGAAPSEDLDSDEKVVLYCTRAMKSSYNGKSRRDYSGLTVDAWEAAKARLIGRGMLNKAGAITPAGRNAAADLKGYELGIRGY